jgi:hypothetical protein
MKRLFSFGLLAIIFCLGSFSYALAAGDFKVTPKVEGKNVTISWDRSWEKTNQVKYYKVFRGNKYVGGKAETEGKPKVNSFTEKNVPDGSYVYTVVAYLIDGTEKGGQTDEPVKIGETTASSEGQPIPIGARFPGEPEKVSLIDHIMYVHKWASIIGTLAAILMIIFAGFKYTTSTGNPEALQDAKDTIIGALIGLSIILLTYILLQVVGIKVERAPL